MLDTILGIPIHPLIVHATVVAVPSAALAVLLATLSPRFRAWAGWLPAGLSVVALALVPLSTSSGESLEARVGESSLVEEHAELGDMLIWWMVPLALAAVAAWWLRRDAGNGGSSRSRISRSSRSVGRWGAVVNVVAVVAALGALVQVVLIGHSGAEAAWSGVGSTTAASSSTGDGD